MVGSAQSFLLAVPTTTTMSRIRLACPACRGRLEASNEGPWSCAGCGRTFPCIAGIPDLRLVEGPFISNAGDREKATRLHESGNGKSFDELVALYYALTPEVPPADAARFRGGIASARSRAGRWLRRWEGAADPVRSEQVLVDVGCGTAPILHAGANRYQRLVGIDIALRWLVIAKRGLEESGIEAELICASAESLPLPDGAATRVVFMASLEHLPNQQAAVGEARRILVPGGACHVVTPNRWSLGPDPHVGIWAGAILPAGIVRRMARARGALPPERRLLSRSQLGSLFRGGGFRRVETGFPAPTPEQLNDQPAIPRALGGIYRSLLETPIIGRIVGAIGPLVEGTGVA